MPMNVIVCMLLARYYVSNQTRERELTTGGLVYEPMAKEINTS